VSAYRAGGHSARRTEGQNAAVHADMQIGGLLSRVAGSEKRNCAVGERYGSNVRGLYVYGANSLVCGSCRTNAACLTICIFL
jgi:hypothetical protein